MRVAPKLGVALALGLLGPASAGAVTLGATNFPADAASVSYGGGGTVVNSAAPPGIQTASPVDGVITRWRVGAAGPVTLHVIRRTAAATTFFGRALGKTETPANAGAVNTYEARIPIDRGDYVGLDLGANNSGAIAFSPGGAPWQNLAWLPALDTTPRPATGASTSILHLNADVEADADRDGFGDDSQDRCPGSAGTDRGCAPGVLDPQVIQVVETVQVVQGGGATPPGGLASIAAKGTNLSKDRKTLSVPVSCPPGRTKRCKGSVLAKSRGLKLGSAKFDLGAGASSTLRIKVSREARKKIQKLKKVPLSLTLTESETTSI